MSGTIKINPISPRTHALLEMETIESQFPLAFDDGGGFPMFTAHCAQCNRPIENQHLRGLITRPRKDMYVVEAAGACFSCNIATPLYYRLHQDGTMSGISPESNQWEEWDTRPGVIRKILHFLRPGRF